MTTRRVRVQDYVPGAVYCGRGRGGSSTTRLANPDRRPNESGYFGNPHSVGYCNFCSKDRAVFHRLGEAVDLYEREFHALVTSDAAFRAAADALRGKPLECWCERHARCHVDVIVRYLEAR